MKKVISVFLVLSMLLSLSLPAFSAEKKADGAMVVVNLSDYQTITGAGLKASTEQTMSGSFTTLLEGNALTKTSTIPVTTSDFSQGKYLEVSIFSPEKTATALGILLMSDNPATSSKDYYYTVLNCDFKNWKKLSVALEQMNNSGTPKGLNSIDSVQIVPGYGGSGVDSHAKLFIDDIYITASQSADANQTEKKTEIEPLVVWSAENNGKTQIYEIDGVKCVKWGPGKEALINQSPAQRIDMSPSWDLSRYKNLMIDMYSVKNTGNVFCVTLYGSDNPETQGRDFYWTKFPSNWEGEWRQVEIPIQGGEGNAGGFSYSRSPDFLPIEGEFFGLGGQGLHGDNFVEDTEVYVSKIYFAGDANAKDPINPAGDLIYEDNFDPETQTDYVAMVKAKHPRKHHPRLLVTDEILARIKKYKDIDPFVKAAYNAVKRNADKYLTEAPPPPTSTMLSGSVSMNRNHLEDVTEACGMMYLLTGDKKYPARIWEEIVTIIDADVDWVKSANATGLDSGHLSNAIALAYDWCYDFWTKDQKQYMRNGVMKYALYNASRIRNGGGYLGMANNVVAAISKGYMTACLAWCDEPGYENYANEYINSVIKYVPGALLYQYVPDGMYSEGIGYWWYSVTMFSYMLTAMQTAIGTDGGLGDHEGFSKTAYMPFYIRGPKGAFDFSDSTKTSLQYGTPVYFYLDDRYNIPSASAFRLSTYEKTSDLDMLDLVWYNPETKRANDWRTGLKRDFVVSGLEPIVSLRSSYDPDAYYIAGKGGNSRTGHDQYDAGSFVIDALGKRWIEDTGPEVYEYDTPSYYRYRERPEGNNCLFVDPTRDWKEGGGQTLGKNSYDTMSTITASGTNDGAAYGIVDNAPSYKETLSKYERGFALVNNRTQFIVRDEIETLAPYELYSYYHTSKGFTITEGEDKNSFVMKAKDGQLCKVHFFSDIPGFDVGVMDAVHHEASPKPGPNNVPHADNSGFQKLYFHADKVTKGHITAVFTPMMEDDKVELPEIIPFSEWNKYLENQTSLTSISIDGVPLVGFNAGVGSYKFETEKVGLVTATASDDVEVSITQANAIGETALIKATNKNTGKEFTYSVNFAPYTIPGISNGFEIVSYEAPYIPEPQNPPANMFDGNFGTRFAVDGTDGSAQFIVDLGAPKKITGFSISFYNGHTRKNKFAMEVSDDKQTWKEIFFGCTPGTTDALVAFNVDPVEGRYVRFKGYGCYAADEQTVVNTFNSITEFSVYGDADDFNDTKGHWAQSEIYFAKNYGLVNGVGDNNYAPENSVTRAEFITMMVRGCGFMAYPYEDGTFADVASSDWFSTNVMTAKEKGIIPPEMVADGNFYPNIPLTREEMCAIATLAFSASTRTDVAESGTTGIFTDLSDGPYLSYIDKAIGLRITNGMSADTFAPKANITRAQAAAILRRVYLKVYNTNN